MSLSFELVQLIGIKFALFDILQYFCFKPGILHKVQKHHIITTDSKANGKKDL